jgi:hypothetical protein
MMEPQPKEPQTTEPIHRNITPSNLEATMSTANPKRQEKFLEIITGGSLAEAIGGIAVVVLSILGLAHVAPNFMIPIATLVVGGALLFQGASVAIEYSELIHRIGGSTLQNTTLGGGVSTEILAGVAGIVLGILALLAIDPAVLLPVAVIVFGGALVISSGEISRLNSLKMEVSGAHETAQHVANEAMTAASGTQVLIGLASIVLGILALIGLNPGVLSLVALLAIGTAILLSGTAVSGKMMSMLYS